MYALLSRHFEGVRQAVFEADLAEKNWVLLIKTPKNSPQISPPESLTTPAPTSQVPTIEHLDGDEDPVSDLKGFSTLLLYRTQIRGQRLRMIYSGDTIIDPSIWNYAILPRAWIGAINALYRQEFYDHEDYGQDLGSQALGQAWEGAPNSSPERLFWLLICSGFRTYRLMPVFWRSFYPHYQQAHPELARLLPHLAQERFGQRFDPRQGVVKLDSPQRLRDRLSGIPAGRELDPHVAFFDQCNPGHPRGDELVCLTEIHPDNLTRAGLRMWNAAVPLEITPPARFNAILS
jgi:hypothetical protein